VSLDGVAVGNVQSISLTPRPQDSAHNVTVVMRVDAKYRNEIRTDSTASLITSGLLGNRYVTITRGLTGTVIPPGGIVPGKEEAAMKQIVERGADLMENLGALSDDLRGIVDDVHRGRGTIGKLMNDPALYDRLNSTAGKLDTVVSSIQSGQGTLGKLTTSDEIYAKTSEAMDHINSVLGAVQEQKGAFGKFVYDPAMYNSAKSLVDKGNSLFDGINQGQGTLGKLVRDDTLYNSLRDASSSLRDATAKLNTNQGTIGKFFNDPAFYDNVTGLTGDMRLFINDFQKNPQKFLHVKFSLF
jgi:phospholipid/cholesterol/gamma-HCH transport system substrate-binding protein